MYGLLELPASRPVAVQPACREAATDWNDGSENAAALHVDVNRADCCFTAPVTFALGAVGTDGPWPPDAGSCSGDSAHEWQLRLADIGELCGCHELVDHLCEEACANTRRSARVKSRRCSDDSSADAPKQQLRSCLSGQSSGHYSSQEVLLMGDDFECMDSVEASRLLEEASLEYPGGVDAALADMYAACSQEQLMSASAGPAAGASTALLGQWQQSEIQAGFVSPGGRCYYQHQYQHQCGGTMPSLAAVAQTPSSPVCYAPNIMLPCCQWSAFSNDPVGAVLAGREPAAKYLAPCGSSCSSRGLTDCLMQLGPA